MKKADKSMEDTGERMIPSYHKGSLVYGEHIVRYQAAKDLVKNKVVLDIASGSGYGSNYLSSFAKKVCGVDVDPEAIRYANKNYSNNKTQFELGDGKKIPFGAESFDIVISFETIEHIKKYENFMSEIKRVLKKDGLLILSTPNINEFPKGNHYHVHEFNEKELYSLVNKYFKNNKKYFQTTWVYNMLSSKDLFTKEWQYDIQTINTAPAKGNRALYFYMLCSNRKIGESINPLAAISEHWSTKDNDEYENSMRKFIEEQGELIIHLDAQLKIMNRRFGKLNRLVNKIKK